MEFNWERFKIKNMAVECCNKEEMVDFLDLLENNDIYEHELKKYLLENNECFKYPIYFEARKYWNRYSVEWNDSTYYQDANYTILKWSDYMNCNKEYLGNESKEINKMEFNWERFKLIDIAVECCNKEEMVDFLDSLKNNDINEHKLKEHLLESGGWFEYPICFVACYSPYNYYYVVWNGETYYKNADYTILKWKDYMHCNSVNNKELSTKEQLENKIYSIEEELKVAKQQLEELKAKEQLSPRQQFEKDIKCFDIKLSDKDEEKAELREKIYRELTLFARLNNDECDSEYLKDNNNLAYSIYFNHKHNKIYQVCLIYLSSEWIPFKSEEVCRAAIELFRDDLEKYYNM